MTSDRLKASASPSGCLTSLQDLYSRLYISYLHCDIFASSVGTKQSALMCILLTKNSESQKRALQFPKIVSAQSVETGRDPLLASIPHSLTRAAPTPPTFSITLAFKSESHGKCIFAQCLLLACKSGPENFNSEHLFTECQKKFYIISFL